MLGPIVRLFGSAATAAAAPASSSTPTSGGPYYPPILYGTAWKQSKTCELVQLALRTGFRAIDTACQPKHYNEAAVGEAVELSGLPRDDVWLQTKYTPLSGQDPQRVPYDTEAPLEEQVHQSVKASLCNLRTSYIDCLILHSPLPTYEETFRVWRAMESHVASGEVKSCGISNIYDARTLARLCDDASVKPLVVQNRFVEEHGRHDVEVRRVCAERSIHYSSFWTLTGNKKILHGRAVQEAAKAHSCTPEQAWMAFVSGGLGISPLSGTTSETHMKHDLELPILTEKEVERLGHLIG